MVVMVVGGVVGVGGAVVVGGVDEAQEVLPRQKRTG